MRHAKKQAFLLIALLAISGRLSTQDDEIFILPLAVSKDKTIVYKRVIRFVKDWNRWHVRDYFENGQMQMEACYSSFNRNVKEEYQCNYRSNTKEGEYRQWYANGRLEFSGNYEEGLRNGPSTSWYENGIKEAEENWLHGQLYGAVKYWTEQGELQFALEFDHGMNRNPMEAHYRYLAYLPKGYADDPGKKWPLIIFLHGGSRRGSDLKKLYADGIFDQVYRGRNFPFVIAAPQCPEHIRWSTENWFENFFREVTGKYRIDLDRVYLTGNSLGGSGTWYLAVKYAGKIRSHRPAVRVHPAHGLYRKQHRQAERHADLGVSRKNGHRSAVRGNGKNGRQARGQEQGPEVYDRTGGRARDPLAGLPGAGVV
ncbi:MAG: hypothetical protein MZV70_49505 [Desulfobacterales bacterium]|nr:hypothetical protein [Desulfobacterales bacterium]